MDCRTSPSTADAGFSWLPAGHGAKLTLSYRSRPIFMTTAEGVVADRRASEFVTQLQTAF